MGSFDTSLLYVLSGTGNTYRVACWIKESFEEKGIKTQLKFIEDADLQSDFQNSEKQLTALLFPTHGFMPPWSMIKFLFRMPRQNRVPVMSIATRGAICLGVVKIPGAAGFSNFFSSIILLLKGFDVRGFFSVDMAANMNNIHPSHGPEALKKISEKARKKIDFFLSPVFSGKRVLFTLNNLYEAIWSILLFWYIPIFPILYLIYGKTSMAKIMFANNNCVSCGMCAKLCPNNGIEMKNFLGKKRPFWTYHCENCMRCMGYCKKKAVEAGHSLGAMQFFLITIPVFANILAWLTVTTGISFEIKNFWLQGLFESLYYLPALFLSYWVFWMMIRIPVVNTIFSVTTLTHYFKRYHEPETSIKDLLKRKRKDKKE